MALQAFAATTTSGTSATVFTTSAGHETAVISMEIYGGTSGGKVTFTKNNGSSDVFSWDVPVSAGTYVMVDTKSFYPATWSLKAVGDASGIQICVNADDVEV